MPTSKPLLNGSLQANSDEQITFSFVPKQIGEFNFKKIFEVYGKVTTNAKQIFAEKEKRKSAALDHHAATKKKIIFSKEINLYGIAKLNPVKPTPMFNSGITPYITNEVGLMTDIKFSNVAKVPRNTRASVSASVLLQSGRSTRSAELVRSMVAVPNDRAQSIRPTDGNTIYRNLFNKELRYTYIDMDYMYTQQKAKEIQKNQDNYKFLMSEIRKKKNAQLEKYKFYAANNELDLGLTRAAGLEPKPLRIKDVEKSYQKGCRKLSNKKRTLFSTKQLMQNQQNSTLMQVSQGLNAIPRTVDEKIDCAKELTPTQLHLLNIGPTKIDYGKVCRKSRNTKNLIVVNNLHFNILIVAQMGCEELCQSGPLSQVVPPHSKAHIPIIFESDIQGKFSKSITYTINHSYENHICVLAEVVPVALEIISPLPLIVTPVPGLMPESSFSSVVTLSNKLNYPAAFTWIPNTNGNMTAFTIQPMQGTVEEYQELDCEVMWTPGYMSPDTGSFTLDVLDGNTIEFQCKAQLGSTNVHFLDQRLVLVNSPINLTTYGTATLVNTGNNHAYFQVVDTNPVVGMTITPVTGIIPVGGEAELQLSFTPTSLLKFDFSLEVAIRNWRNLILRVGGSVENPCIEINVPSFTFGVVYCGSEAAVDFTITNQSSAIGRIDFDLSSYKDFRLSFDNHQTEEDYRFQTENPGMYTLKLRGDQIVNGKMIFQPTKLAAYYFIMPVNINNVSAPTPVSISTPTLMNSSSQQLYVSKQGSASLITPRKMVSATGLKSIVNISQFHISFEFPDIGDDRTTPSPRGLCQFQDVTIDNNIDEVVRWDIDLSVQSAALEDGIIQFIDKTGVPLKSSKPGFVGSVIPEKGSKVFRVVCQPKTYCNYEFSVPLYIHGDFTKVYKQLSVSVHMKSPKVTFNPPIIHTCVPLMVEKLTMVELFCINYESPPVLNVKCPEVENEDGTLMTPFSVMFLQNAENFDDSDGSQNMMCQVKFMANKPTSFRKAIIFSDQYNNSFSLSVVSTADNSLLTCYGFLINNQQVCALGTALKRQKSSSNETIDSGEVMCAPCHAARACPSVISSPSSSTDFQLNSSVMSELLSTEKHCDSGFDDPETYCNDVSPLALSESKLLPPYEANSKIFPLYDRKVEIYHQNVLNAVQRWFSANGWPCGTFPVSIPHTFRSAVCVCDGEKIQRTKSSKKTPMTIYHSIKYLTGYPLPGINGVQTIPVNTNERVKQIYSQHSVLLTFLKYQGGCVASIKPEYLMEYPDFLLWKKFEMAEGKTDESADNDKHLMDHNIFEIVSKRAWLDTLMQIIKCLVLSKVTPRILKQSSTSDENLKVPAVEVDRICSHIYSTPERILLAWMNHSYESYREKIWSAKDVCVPGARWIVNFDLDLNDGLVIGALIGAYLPFLIPSHISKMITLPASYEHHLHNSLKIVTALRSVGIDYDIQAMDITEANPICMLLFCTYLFQILPQYIPKNTLEFVGNLSQTITKKVKLSNPSGKAVHYIAAIVGGDAENFSLPEGNSVTIQPNRSVHLPIVFYNKFLRSNYTTLILAGRHFGTGVGENMSFSLKTETANLIPQNVQTAETHCYELLSIPLEVVNPFGTSGEFALSFIEGIPSQNNKKKNLSRKASRHSIKRLGKDVNSDPSSAHIFIVKSFHCRQQKVYLEASKKQTVDISFLPFAIGAIQCSVVFSNNKLGDFVYEIRATVTRPPPLRVLTKNEETICAPRSSNTNCNKCNQKNVIYWRCKVGETLNKSIWIPIINCRKEKALLQLAKFQMSDLEYNRRVLTGTADSSTRAAEVFNQIRTHAEAVKQNLFPCQEFTIEHDFKYFITPRTLQIPLSSTVKDTQCIELPLIFLGETQGHYSCELLLKSVGDIRLYQIECTVIPDSGPTYITFQAPVFQKRTQDIPIINPTNHDWNLKIKIRGEAFMGPTELFVPKKGTIFYVITYKPTIQGETEGELIITENNEIIEMYFLVGKATEPMASGVINIDSVVREKTKYTLKVPNPTKRRLTYEVHSNLPFLKGLEYISVSSGQVGHYHLDVIPVKCGRFEGVINFVAGKNSSREVDSDGDDICSSEEGNEESYRAYVWYILKMNFKAGPPVDILNITGPCQKKTYVNINVTNPTDQNLSFQVTINGPGLHGPSSLFVTAGQQAIYNLTFSPNVLLEHVGSLHFFNEHVRETWYQLNLKSEPPETIVLPKMECKFGMSVSQEIVLANESDETWEMIPILSDKSFRLNEYPEEKWPISVAPASSLSIQLTFVPSSLAEKESYCDISFVCEQIGKLTYAVKGCVLLPSKNPSTTLYSVTGQCNEGIVKFYNPLDTVVYINVKLKGESEIAADGKRSPQTFRLLLSQTESLFLRPHQTLDIPILFTPRNRNTCHAECVVSVHQKNTAQASVEADQPSIDWCFPLIGIPEFVHISQMPESNLSCKMRTKLKTQLEIKVDLNLETIENNLWAQVLKPEQFIQDYYLNFAALPEISYDFEFPNQQARSDLKDIVKIKLMITKKEPHTSNVRLIFGIEFTPQKCIEQYAHLMIYKKGGCLWRFPILFSAGDPDIDDVIKIEAQTMYSKVTVNFFLKAHGAYPQKFVAILTSDSDPEISVTPEEGEFNPSQVKGFCFTVHYNPTSYAQKKYALLFIQTDQNQWTYRIEASLPHYKSPIGKSTYAKHVLPPIPKTEVKKVNFVAENLNVITTAVSSPMKGAPILKHTSHKK